MEREESDLLQPVICQPLLKLCRFAPPVIVASSVGGGALQANKQCKRKWSTRTHVRCRSRTGSSGHRDDTTMTVKTKATEQNKREKDKPCSFYVRMTSFINSRSTNKSHINSYQGVSYHMDDTQYSLVSITWDVIKFHLVAFK